MPDAHDKTRLAEPVIIDAKAMATAEAGAAGLDLMKAMDVYAKAEVAYLTAEQRMDRAQQKLNQAGVTPDDQLAIFEDVAKDHGLEGHAKRITDYIRDQLALVSSNG